MAKAKSRKSTISFLCGINFDHFDSREDHFNAKNNRTIAERDQIEKQMNKLRRSQETHRNRDSGGRKSERQRDKVYWAKYYWFEKEIRKLRAKWSRLDKKAENAREKADEWSPHSHRSEMLRLLSQKERKKIFQFLQELIKERR